MNRADTLAFRVGAYPGHRFLSDNRRFLGPFGCIPDREDSRTRPNGAGAQVAGSAKRICRLQLPGPLSTIRSDEGGFSVIGQTLGRYRVLEKIGAGGMGEIYRARDERLERDVAIKVLPQGLLADEAARKRFHKEALSLSRLNHPNIATVHDFDTQSGVDFLVMEYVPGETLDRQVAKGPLSERDIIRLGMQLAEGMAAAHGQGVVHRDLKPGNLRVTPDGRLKILDFGLAKLVHPQSFPEASVTRSLGETQAGTTPGTLPYMAPEQLRGDPPDARCDLYAAGAVLYELATGRRAFRETLTPRLIDAILHQPPQPPSSLNRQISAGLENIVLKALDKEPNRRYQTARDLRADLERLSVGVPLEVARLPRPLLLRWPLWLAAGLLGLIAVLFGLNVGGLPDRWRGRPAAPRIESLAVLPLENQTGDKTQEYLSDGITDALTTDLAQIGSLRVISKDSVVLYKQAMKPLPEIARELKVDAVVKGSVARSGDHVRITVQLIHTPDGRLMWGRSYEREMRNILDLEGEASLAIAREIQIRLSPEQEARLVSSRAVNPLAQEAYLRGKYAENPAQGLEFLNQAIQTDPQYAPPYVELGSYYWFTALFGVLPPKDAYTKSEESSQKAISLDDTLAAAHATLAVDKLEYHWDWAGADREYRRALDLNPNDADIHHMYAHYLLFAGRGDSSRAETKRAVDLDPLDLGLTACWGWHCVFTHQADEAIEHCQAALSVNPKDWWANVILGWAYEEKSMYSEAVRQFQKANSLWQEPALATASLAHVYAVSGRRADAQKLLAELLKRSRTKYVSAYDLAVVFAGLGDRDQAFQWLDKACDERSSFLVHIRWDPRLDELHTDPRFQDVLRRIGLPPGPASVTSVPQHARRVVDARISSTRESANRSN
jgi:eukaryotic-like serine/threonine-protein kinase